MPPLSPPELLCPYCGEPAEVDVDPGGADLQEFEQDCAVCCRPWRVRVERQEDGEALVTLGREDD
ncbi:MAG: CPXCG motif-containing cysteine-rich protein [Deltaproteobacteria bacterium]